MTNITQEAQRLMERDNLGTSMEIYKPGTVGSSIMSSIIIVIGVGWSLITASMVYGIHVFMGLSSLPWIDSSSSGIDLFGVIPTIIGIIFSLFGLLFIVLGLIGLVRAILNRNNQAVVCTNGVAYVTRKSADAFRWEQVLTVFNKTSVSTHTTRNEHGFTNTHSTVHHKYAVHCHDGRKFAFDGTLNHVEDLAEKIEVEVARQRAMVGQQNNYRQTS